jgi:hypothetical protein
MFAFAQWTDTRMLALVGDPQADAYELLFSFSSPANKAKFLNLLQSNDERNYLRPLRTHCKCRLIFALHMYLVCFPEVKPSVL